MTKLKSKIFSLEHRFSSSKGENGAVKPSFRNKKGLKLVLLIIFNTMLWAMLSATEPDLKEVATVLACKPQKLLGIKVKELVTLFGSPDEVLSHRGLKPEEDNVVFFYQNYRCYFFLYGSRVWAIRLDHKSSISLLGLKMAMLKQDVLASLKLPYQEVDNSLVFVLPEEVFPLRLRLYFENELLKDAYLYRGDF